MVAPLVPRRARAGSGQRFRRRPALQRVLGAAPERACYEVSEHWRASRTVSLTLVAHSHIRSQFDPLANSFAFRAAHTLSLLFQELGHRGSQRDGGCPLVRLRVGAVASAGSGRRPGLAQPWQRFIWGGALSLHSRNIRVCTRSQQSRTQVRARLQARTLLGFTNSRMLYLQRRGSCLSECPPFTQNHLSPIFIRLFTTFFSSHHRSPRT